MNYPQLTFSSETASGAPVTFDASVSDAAMEQVKLLNEARQLIKDAGDKPLDDKASARFAAIESKLADLKEQTEQPHIIESNTTTFNRSQTRPVDDFTTRHPLAFDAKTLDGLQYALSHKERGVFFAQEPDRSVVFAALTTGTYGSPRAWGANVLDGPRLLSQVAGVPRQTVDAAIAQHPQLNLPTAQAAAAEGAAVTEYASSTGENVVLGRFGRWTDLTREARVGTDAAALTMMHRIGIALDLDNALISAINTAAGTAVAFQSDVPAAIRTSIARVVAATAGDPRDVVIMTHPDDAALLQDVAPTSGGDIAEGFTRFAGALIYPSNAVPTGFMLTGNLRTGVRYFEAAGLRTLTDLDVKTGAETAATDVLGGYGVLLGGGAFIKNDVVTP